MPKVKNEINNTAKRSRRDFLIPRDGILQLLIEFASEFYPGEENLRKVSIAQAYDFIDRFTNKYCPDIDDEE